MTQTIHSPKCIAFIMDGNRRWARKYGKACHCGHEEGYNKLKEVMEWTRKRGIDNFIVYAFSTENWNRSKEEVKALIGLLEYVLSEKIKELAKEGCRLRFAGDTSRFSKKLQNLITEAEKQTSKEKSFTLTVALSYGGRAEIVNAVRKVVKEFKGKIDELNEESFKQFLWTSDIPDPDIIVRTGGEMRLSNFLPYQSTYSELFFTKTLWPDFTEEEYENILDEYSSRKINHGK